MTDLNVLNEAEGDGWHLYHADCCEALKKLDDGDADFSIYSPPFASLYTYSNSDRDMGNCRDHNEFHKHFGFLMPEMFRITKPGRNMSVHCMDLPTSKARDGQIGLTDFPGELIRAAERAGWIWHAKVTIFKDPVTAMQRTKAIGLLWRQLKKDSCMSRMGIPDYVLTFRKPGVNASPVSHSPEDFPVATWQKWASPTWIVEDSEKDLELLSQWAGLLWDDINPSDTLQFRSARDEKDERHLAPLQMEVIRRCIRLWSNPGDTVVTPFAGIASEMVVAIEEGRRAVGSELKESYWGQGRRNCAAAEPKAAGRQVSLFELMKDGVNADR